MVNLKIIMLSKRRQAIKSCVEKIYGPHSFYDRIAKLTHSARNHSYGYLVVIWHGGTKSFWGDRNVLHLNGVTVT